MLSPTAAPVPAATAAAARTARRLPSHHCGILDAAGGSTSSSKAARPSGPAATAAAAAQLEGSPDSDATGTTTLAAAPPDVRPSGPGDRCIAGNIAAGHRAAVWEAAFESGLYSDVIVVFGTRSFRLHKVVLQQSPMLSRVLSGSTYSGCVEDFLSLETGGDQRITGDAMECALRDLYNPLERTSRIYPSNALTVLAAACFLELPDLAATCEKYILDTLRLDTVMDYAEGIDVLRPPPTASPAGPRSAGHQPEPQELQGAYGPNHEYISLLRSHHAALQAGVLSYLCQATSAALSDDCDPDAAAVAAVDADLSAAAEALLIQMPVRWIRRVLDCSALCVPDEFARYTLAKRAARLRRSAARAAAASAVAATAVAAPPAEFTSASPAAAASSLASKLLGMLSAGAKRPRADGVDAADDLPTATDPRVCAAAATSASATHESSGRPAKRAAVAGADGAVVRRGRGTGGAGSSQLPAAAGAGASLGLANLYGAELGTARGTDEEREDAVLLGLFQAGIAYTYMTFAQLEDVRRDRIVPDSAVLRSLWSQAELASRATAGPASPVGGAAPAAGAPLPFRFAARFRAVRRALDTAAGAANPRPLLSDAVRCAGVDYRVSLACGAPDGAEDGGGSNTTVGARVLRAHLQRTRPAAGAASAPLAYAVYAFDPARFRRGGEAAAAAASGAQMQWWRDFDRPVTACDRDGGGHVKPFALPEADGDDLWLVVNVEL
ncbi:hypothetical protein HK405_011506 [Cladochytrium tenue]|nr:hypothetical protein HK405_011506 [Cladochytrium tenue]